LLHLVHSEGKNFALKKAGSNTAAAAAAPVDVAAMQDYRRLRCYS
jgi:hypothetical protein